MAGAISLEGLAVAWESVSEIRQAARANGQLIVWPSPETVGIASMLLV